MSKRNLKRIGHTLSPFEIVVVNTSAGKAYGQPDYVSKGCGMGREATLYLLERGVRVTGTDGWSWDAPFVHTKEQIRRDRRRQPDLGRPQGRAARSAIATSRNCTISKPCRRPDFTIACFPVKVRGGSAGWTRAVAIMD